MTLENKIKKGVAIAGCVLMLGYGTNLCYHHTKSSSYEHQIKLEEIDLKSSKRELGEHKKYRDIYKKMKEKYWYAIGLAERRLAQHERSRESCRRMQEVFKDDEFFKKDTDSGKSPSLSFADAFAEGLLNYYEKEIKDVRKDIESCNKGIEMIQGSIKKYENQINDANKKIEDSNKEIEELTQKRELHEKRRFNPFYKVFSK